MKRSAALLLAMTLATGCAGARLAEQKSRIEELQTQAGKLRGQLGDRDQKLAEIERQKSSLEDQLGDLTTKLQDAQTRNDELAKSNRDLSSLMKSTEGQLAAKVKELVAEKDELGGKIAELKKDRVGIRASQRARLKATQAELEAVRAQADSTRRELDSLKAESRKAEETRRERLAKAHEDMGTLADAILKELQSGQAKLDQEGPAIRLTFQEPLLFNPQEAKVTDGGAALLERVAVALRTLAPRDVRVEGHSDNAPIKWELFGRFTSHWDLTAARATAVARWLHEHGGLEPRRITASGFGEFRPARPNDTAEGKAANRRVVLVFE